MVLLGQLDTLALSAWDFPPQDPDFPSLSGARVVRIAVHPELSGAGYGSRALELLKRYFQGELLELGEDIDAEVQGSDDEQQQQQHRVAAAAEDAAAAADGSLLLTEQVKPKAGLPPLMVNLSER
eukprot:GHRR01025214.1.p1 GENE.GHRR01025214.1~~GHRR01025214.1.p1  ORF type:complete len:125 (+),score=73.75 GHRR01025214.1:97-471(+)